jgi:hypothetical protein
MSEFFIAVWCVITIFVLSSPSSFSAEPVTADDSTYQVLDKEQLVQKWNEYLKEMGTLEGTHSVDIWRNGVKDEKNSYTSNFFYNFPYTAKEYINSDGQKFASVHARNYIFRVRTDGKQDEKWIVDELAKVSSLDRRATLHYPSMLANPLDTEYGSTERIGLGICNELYVLMIAPCWALPSFATLDEFNIISNEIVKDENNRPLQRLVFNFRTDDSSKYPDLVIDKPFYLEGDFILETKYRLIKKGTFKFGAEGQKYETTTIDCTYDENILSVPILVTYKEVSDMNDGSVFKAIHSYENIKSCTSGASRFTLSHYGLPEPDFGESRHNRIRYAIMSLGVLLIMIGLWRMYKKRLSRKLEFYPQILK